MSILEIPVARALSSGAPLKSILDDVMVQDDRVCRVSNDQWLQRLLYDLVSQCAGCRNAKVL